MEYRFNIDKQTTLLFRKTVDSSTDWKGDIILERKGEEKVLRDNGDIFGPGGFSYRIYKTNQPDILLLKWGFMDMGIYILGWEYLDIKEGNIIASLTNSQQSELEIKRKNKNNITITFDIDSCDPDKVSPGTKVEFRGIFLDGIPVFSFEKPISLTCVNPKGIGSLYSPNPTIEDPMLDVSFSKVAFSIKVENWKGSIILTLPD